MDDDMQGEGAPETQPINGDVLLDADRMRDLFRAHLRTGAGDRVDVQRCRLDYVRHSSGRRIAQYTLEVADPMTGRPWARTVTGLTYGGRTKKLWSRLLASDPAAMTPVGTPPLLPLVYVPEIDVLVQVFPYDRRLPGLRDLLQGTPELRATLATELGLTGSDDTAWQAEVVRYRPEMRAMVRLGAASARHVYAKIYRDDENGERAHRVLQTLWQHTTTREARFAVARPIGYLPDVRTHLAAALPGQSLLDIVRDAEDDAARCAVRRAARAVAALHQLPLDAGLLMPVERDEGDRLASLVAALTEMDPHQAPALREVSAAIAARLEGAASVSAPTHSDLRLVHVLLDGDRVGLLDFDKLAWGDPLADVANVAAMLLGKERADLAKCFVDEYFAHVPAAWREGYPPHHALALLSEAATTGRGHRGRPEQADRAGRVAAVVEQARAGLAGRLWQQRT